MRAHGEHLAVLRRRELHVGVLRPAVAGGEHCLGAFLDPLDRRADRVRGGSGDELLRIGVQLRAEPAAHVGRDGPHLGLAHTADDRQERAQEVRHLGGAVDGELVGGRVPVGNHPSGLDRDVNQPLVSDGVLDDDIGPRERVVDVVGLVCEHEPDIRVELVVDRGSPLGERLLRRDDRRQRVVGDLDHRGRVGGRVPVGRDDGGDGLARMPHAALRERRPHRVDHVARRVRCARHAGRELQVVAGEDGGDARHRLRLRRVDAGDVGVRVGAAHDRHVLHPRELQVVDEAPLACEELLVLLAVDGLPDALGLLGCDRHHTATPCAAVRTAATMFS